MHLNPQQKEFCMIKMCALALPLSNRLSACSSGNADEKLFMAGFAVKTKWDWRQVWYSHLLIVKQQLLLHMEQLKTESHSLSILSWWCWCGGVFFDCSVCFWGVFPKYNGGNVTGKEMGRRSRSSVFVVPYCSIRLHPSLKHLSSSRSTVSYIMSAGKSQQCWPELSFRQGPIVCPVLLIHFISKQVLYPMLKEEKVSSNS